MGHGENIDGVIDPVAEIEQVQDLFIQAPVRVADRFGDLFRRGLKIPVCSGMYEDVQVTTVEGIGCFRCRKAGKNETRL